MKIHLNIRPILMVFVSIFLMCTFSQNAYSQNSQKNKVRLSASYFKTMNQEAFIDIKATSKINKKTVGISNIELSIYYEINDEKISLGIATTNMDGKNKFLLKNINNLKPDSTGAYNISINFKGNDLFKKSSTNISFKDVNIHSQIITKDSVHYITATLVNTYSKKPIADESLEIKVARLFKPLNIGQPFYKTNEEGAILVPIEKGIPGVNGNLTIQVVLNDSDDYGTVTDLTKAKIGVPIVEESTFDQRTMWSPRNKTPLFLLILPNIFIIAIWGFIFYLISNLFKLHKSS